MERKKITPNLITPEEEEQAVEKLEKVKKLRPRKKIHMEKPHRLTFDIPVKLYEPLQRERVKDGYTTLSSAILDLIRKYVNE